MTDPNRYQAVAVARPEGGVSIHRIITRTPFDRFSADVAIALGFILTKNGEWWEGGITDEGIEMEIERAGLSPNAGWARVSNSDLPSREHRNRWQLVDGRVVVAE